MSEVLEYIGTIGDIFKSFFELVINLFSTLGEKIVNGFALLVEIIVYIPNIIVNSMFSNLPSVFQTGLTSLFSIFILLFVLKLFQLIKFW